MFRRLRNRPKAGSFDTDIMRVLNLIPSMDILSVLVIFLLITAVFTHITIMELNIPTRAGASAVNVPNFSIEVIVRKAGLEIANGSSVETAIPKKDDKYDLEMLSKMLTRLKAQYPEKEDATVLVEPDIQYDYLVQIMDVLTVLVLFLLFHSFNGELPEQRLELPDSVVETRPRETLAIVVNPEAVMVQGAPVVSTSELYEDRIGMVAQIKVRLEGLEQDIGVTAPEGKETTLLADKTIPS